MEEDRFADDRKQDGSVTDNRQASRFEIALGDQPAVLVYKRTPTSLELLHTEVPPPFRGRRLGEALVKAAIDAAHAEGLQIVAACPFVRAYLRKHPS